MPLVVALTPQLHKAMSIAKQRYKATTDEIIQDALTEWFVLEGCFPGKQGDRQQLINRYMELAKKRDVQITAALKTAAAEAREMM